MYKLVIFDLDGTLLDTIGDLAAAGNHTLEAMGLPAHDEAAYKKFVGNGIPKLIERMLPSTHTKEQEQLALSLFTEYYSAHKSDRTKPYDGMPELVSRLDARGIICVCNSNKAHEFSSALVEAAYHSSVRGVIGAGIGFGAKPCPDAALKFCEKYSVPKERALYVGDSDVDILTAKNAGIDCCCVLWGFRSYEELAGYAPKYFAKTPEDLERII